jgi:polyferredoxin
MVGIITGRAVCGWACPVGLLQRATAKVARKLKPYSPIPTKVNQSIDQKGRYLKYIILIGLVILTPFFIGFMFTDLCPVGFLVGTIPISLLNPGGFIPSFYFYPASVIFILFLILIFTVERGWCRYFCPIGAILAPFNKISMYHVEVDKESCVHCNVCSTICPMGIDIPNMHRDPECILCGKCVTACPKSIIKFKRN